MDTRKFLHQDINNVSAWYRLFLALLSRIHNISLGAEEQPSFVSFVKTSISFLSEII